MIPSPLKMLPENSEDENFSIEEKLGVAFCKWCCHRSKVYVRKRTPSKFLSNIYKYMEESFYSMKYFLILFDTLYDERQAEVLE